MSTLRRITRLNPLNDHEHGETSSSLFSNGQKAPPAFNYDNDDNNNNNSNIINNNNALPTTSDPKPPADFLNHQTTIDRNEYRTAQHYNPNDKTTTNNNTPASLTQQQQQAKWTKDDIALMIILPIVLTTLLCLSLRHCYVANSRHAQFHERRQSIRAAQRAETREMRRLKEKGRKERAKEIEKAIVTKTACKCKCSSSMKKQFGSMSDLTMHTNATDDMSTSSSYHDVENPAVTDNENDDGDDNDDDETSSSCQTCAICLEPYIGGKDKVSWSKFQTCHHAFHQKCIQGWLEETKNVGNCPCCRGPYLKEDVSKSEIVLDDNTMLNEASEESTIDEERRGNDRVQTRNEERHIDEEMVNNMNETPGEESNIHEETQHDDPRVQQQREPESNDDENNGGVATTTSSTPGGNTTPTIIESQRVTGLDFTSFCIIHGLKRDVKKCDNAFLSMKPTESSTLLGNGEG